MDFYVYILYSDLIDRFYVGCTGSMLKERLRKHNTKHSGFTGRANDWRLMYYESFQSQSDAYNREREIKNKKSRKFIEHLILEKNG
ncbi:MAG TPA: excinuclease ABC subunit C [Flavobacteriaceae bacterium]|nr:excinuclease ABC subunit C [Flavobacteriaceae bacterium]MAY53744.1 excinuclease ABC subunit C [Flavobacteriaceae bacterium]HBR53097.1 excinuclease ABC subunit C [Flavobacteriaceae bacterium]|tara:strand:+ start:1030 stop:1287 length:258 start_codon:yes stop_codon:yes gene_type:complete